jgi:hypothetical protein
MGAECRMGRRIAADCDRCEAVYFIIIPYPFLSLHLCPSVNPIPSPTSFLLCWNFRKILGN